MKKFLTSLLCICMVVVMMPFTGNVDFSASAAAGCKYIGKAEESQSLFEPVVSKTNETAYINICDTYELKSTDFSGIEKFVVTVDGTTKLTVTGCESKDIEFRGSGFAVISGSFVANNITVDGPTICGKDLEINAKNLTVKRGEIEAKKINVTGTYTQDGGKVYVSYTNVVEYSTGTNTSWYWFRTYEKNQQKYALSADTINVNGGVLDVDFIANEYEYVQTTDTNSNTFKSEVIGTNRAITATNMTCNGGIVNVNSDGYAITFYNDNSAASPCDTHGWDLWNLDRDADSTKLTISVLNDFTINSLISPSTETELPAIDVKNTLTVNDGIIFANCRVDDGTDVAAIQAGTFVDQEGECSRWFNRNVGSAHVGTCIKDVNVTDSCKDDNYVMIAKGWLPDSQGGTKNNLDSMYIDDNVYAHTASGGSKFDNALYTTKDITVSGTDARISSMSNLTLYTEGKATIQNVSNTDICIFASTADLSGYFDGQLYVYDKLTISGDVTLGEHAVVKVGHAVNSREVATDLNISDFQTYSVVTIDNGETLTVDGDMTVRGECMVNGSLIVNNKLTIGNYASNKYKYRTRLIKGNGFVSGNNGLILVNDREKLASYDGEGHIAANIYGLVDILNTENSKPWRDVQLVDNYGLKYNNTYNFLTSPSDIIEGTDIKNAVAIKTGIYPTWVGGQRIVVSGTDYNNPRDGEAIGTWVPTTPTNGYFEAFKYDGDGDGTKYGPNAELIYYPQTANLPAKLYIKNANIKTVNVVGPENDGLKYYGAFAKHSASATGLTTYDVSARAAIYSNNSIDIEYEGKNEIDIENISYASNSSLVVAGIYSPYSVAVYGKNDNGNELKITGAKNELDDHELNVGHEHSYALAVGIYGDDVKLGYSLASETAASMPANDRANKIYIKSANLPKDCEYAMTAGIFAQHDAILAHDSVEIKSGSCVPKNNTYTYGVYALNDVKINDSNSINISNDNNGYGEGIHACNSFKADKVDNLVVQGIGYAIRAFYGEDTIEPIEDFPATITNAVELSNIGSGLIKAGSGIKGIYTDINNAKFSVEATANTGIGIETAYLGVGGEASKTDINITAGTPNGGGNRGIQALYSDIQNGTVNVTAYKNNGTEMADDEETHSYGVYIGYNVKDYPDLPWEVAYNEKCNEVDGFITGHNIYTGLYVHNDAKLNINNKNIDKELISDFGIYNSGLKPVQIPDKGNFFFTGREVIVNDAANVNVYARNVGVYENDVLGSGTNAKLYVKTYYPGSITDSILSSYGGIITFGLRFDLDKVRLNNGARIVVDSASTGINTNSIKSYNDSEIDVLAAADGIETFGAIFSDTTAVVTSTNADGIVVKGNFNIKSDSDVTVNAKVNGIAVATDCNVNGSDVDVTAETGYGIFVADDYSVEKDSNVTVKAALKGIVSSVAMVKDTSKVNAKADNFGIDADKLWVVDRAKVTGTAEATGTDNSIGVNADLLWVEGNANASTNTNEQFAVLTGNGGKIGIKTDHLWLLKDKHFTKVVANGGDYGIEVDDYSYINDGYVYAYGEKAAIHASGTDSLNLDLGEGYKVVKTFETKKSIKGIETVTGTNTMGLDYESYVKFTSGTNAVQMIDEPTGVAKTVFIYYPMEVLVYTDVHNTEAFNGFKTLPYDEANHTVFVTGEICSWIRDYNPKEGFNVPRQVKVGAYTGYDWYNELYMARGNYKVKIEQNGEDVTNDIDGSSNMLDSYFGEGVYVLKYVRGNNNVFSRPVDLTFASNLDVGSTTDLGNGITVEKTAPNRYIVTLDNVTIDLEHYAQFMSTDAALKLPEGKVTLFVSGTNYIMAADTDDANYTRMVYGIKQKDDDESISNTLTFDGNDGATLNVVGSENVLKLYEGNEVIGMADNRYLTVQSATYTNMNIIDGVKTKFESTATNFSEDGEFVVGYTYVSETDASPTDWPTVASLTNVRTAVFKINKFAPTIRDHSYNYNYAIYGTTYHYNGSKLSSFPVSTNAGRTVSLNTELGKADKYFAANLDRWYFTSNDKANYPACTATNYLEYSDTNSNDSIVSVIAATNTDLPGKFNLKGRVEMSPVAKNVDEKNAVTYFACGNATAKAGVNVKKYIAPVYYGGPVAPAPVTTTYTVTFNANGHGTNPAAKTVTSGSKVTSPAAPTAEGYVFGGWYKEASCLTAFDFSSAVTSNVTLYAKWTEADEEFDLAGALAKIKLKASTVYTSKDNTKVTATVVEGQSAIDEIKAEGYSVYYRFYRSTAAKKGYKSRVTKTAGNYLNNEGVLGTRYYYKAVLVIKNENGSEVGKTALTQCTYGKRVFKGEVEED